MELSNEHDSNNENYSSRNIKKRITDVISKNKFNLTNNYDLKNDLLFFKNDLLKDFRNMESKLNEKILNSNEEHLKILNSYENKFLAQNEKIEYLSNLITDYFRKEKFEKHFEEFRASIKDISAEMESKIYLLQDNIKDVLYKQQKFFNENLLYPGIIGNKCKFKDFHAFVDYVLESIHQIEDYQEMLKAYELHKLKKNLENDLGTIKLQIKNNFQILSNFTTEKINESEEKMKKVLDDYNTQFVDVRIENNKNANYLEKKISEVSHNFDQIIKIRKEINKKYKEQEKKFEDICQNIAGNENKIIEQKKEINNIDNKFKLLTTFIDNQNDENNDYYNNFNTGNFKNIKYNKSKRIQSAKDFIDRQMRLISKGIINNNENNQTLNKTEYNSISNDRYNKDNKNNNDYNKNARSIDDKRFSTKNFVINKKMTFRGDSFIKKYISEKIGIEEMYNHPKHLRNKDKNEKKEINYETSQARKSKYYSPNEDISKFFNLNKLQSQPSNKRKNKIKIININNDNYQTNKIITKSLSDGNYGPPNEKVMSHENFMKEINNILYRKKIYNPILSPFTNNYRQTSNNRFIEQQLVKDKKFNNAMTKRKKKLLIIQ